jgi:peptidoglycan hydrolase-like protein with peptidoglycan-binding domain
MKMKKIILLSFTFLFAGFTYAQTTTLSSVNLTVSSTESSKEELTVTLTENFNFTRNLSLGMKGEDVRMLQIYLNMKGYKVVEPTKETNYFGSLTLNALKKFQSANGIPATGYFGVMTRAKVNQLEGR